MLDRINVDKLDKPVISIIGPTGIGKSAASIQLAREIKGEVISVDAFQVYKGMDIGTAKVSLEERKEVPHHLIDIVSPNESYSVANFMKEVGPLIKAIQERGARPILCGGTGLYLRSFLYDYVYNELPSDDHYRASLEAMISKKGRLFLWSMLEKVDKQASIKISPNDSRRVIRALEVNKLTGIPMSQQVTKSSSSRQDVSILGLTAPRECVRKRIDDRVDNMFQSGLIREVEGLLSEGYSPSLNAFKALGYKETISYLNGSLSKKELIEWIKTTTKQFAKRQMTWFRRFEHVEWLTI